ncbi:MAG TPA: GNAT family N-acetyltransferase [Bryobacteraceae bacterium]|nr:GNAT family N-acetyltransferase [Bryobacteraceae bacterium]
MSDIHIRPGVEDDIPVILDLIRALAEYEKARPEEVPVDQAVLRESLFGARPAAEVLLAEVDGETVGFALFFHNFSTWQGRRGLYLEDLFVRPEMRGRGIGKALLCELARLAMERGCARMEWAVLDWNTPSIEFYRSLGAVPMDQWTIFRLTTPDIGRLAVRYPLTK